MRQDSTAPARIEMRTSKEIHALLKRAASLQNRTMTDFILDTIQREARKVIQENDIVSLSIDDQMRFAEALLSPPRPALALKRAFKRRRKMIVDE
ncbi:MAG: DUF1778 domain-containing protein [Candidatus Coatesbacteria bacterium]|nr:DUF1778 domain-containing protein [Candidatus Coatesbacteria bacterium]